MTVEGGDEGEISRAQNNERFLGHGKDFDFSSKQDEKPVEGFEQGLPWVTYFKRVSLAAM